jgi:hypothetical protein
VADSLSDMIIQTENDFTFEVTFSLTSRKDPLCYARVWSANGPISSGRRM